MHNFKREFIQTQVVFHPPLLPVAVAPEKPLIAYSSTSSLFGMSFLLNALKALRMRSTLSLSIPFHSFPRLAERLRLESPLGPRYLNSIQTSEMELNYEESRGEETRDEDLGMDIAFVLSLSEHSANALFWGVFLVEGGPAEFYTGN